MSRRASSWAPPGAGRTLLSLALLAANTAAERKAVRHSDALICLSARDGEMLRRLYGRGADHVSPIAVDDALPSPRPAVAPGPPYLLFVGGAFYANRRGIEWFARKVAPHAPLPTMIVGQGMEALRQEFGTAPHLRIVGAVDDLAPCYAGALCAVAPVFDGSGMKTKIAEALMFGKRVIGTREAFFGLCPRRRRGRMEGRGCRRLPRRDPERGKGRSSRFQSGLPRPVRGLILLRRRDAPHGGDHAAGTVLVRRGRSCDSHRAARIAARGVAPERQA